MKRLISLGLAIVLGGSAVTPSFAQPAGGGLRAACGADMARMCADAAAGDARRQCIMAHKDQLSDACKSAIVAAMAARRAAGVTSAAPHN